MSERARALPAKPRRPAPGAVRPPRRDEQLSDDADAVQRLANEAGNRATLRALDALGPAQRHPAHEQHALGPGANRYEVLGVAVPPPRGGKALPHGLRGQMERAFNTNLGSVRLQEDGSARDLDALAYTRGADITVAPGHLQPHSGSGKRLIAHELVHVIQQRADRVPSPHAEEGLPVNEDHSLEREADRLGRRASWGLPAPVHGARDTVHHRPTGVAQPAHGSM
ncbi:MAG: DUF4157 domain-containing protein [Dehalococcoidia bacterium]